MRTALFLGLLLGLICPVLAGCGERPQRIGPESSASAATPPSPAVSPVRFAGTLALQGALAEARTGAVFVSARRKGQRLPTLSHKYGMDDPGWFTREGKRLRPFSLTEEDNMGGFGAPMGAEMEVEVRYSPSGFIDPSPGASEEGAVRASVPAAPGDRELAIELLAPSAK